MQAVLDIENSLVKLNGVPVPMRFTEDDFPSLVTCAASVEIAPRTTQWVEVEVALVPDGVQLPEVWVMIPHTAYALVSTCYTAAASLPPEMARTELCFTNTGDHVKRIPRGEVLGVASYGEVLTPKILSLGEEAAVNMIGTAEPEEGPADLPAHLFELLGTISPELPCYQCAQVYDALVKYQDVFMALGDVLQGTGLVTHRIDMGDTAPVKVPPRRMSHFNRQVITEQVAQMLADGIIQPSSGPWAFPVVIVRKKDGTHRFCVDYRELNAITWKDAYPLPRLDDSLDNLGGAKWFSALDLASGYWQVKLHPRDVQKTAFTTHEGLYEFKSMPFRLTNAPATFELLMELVLQGLTREQCQVYLDDIIIFGTKFDI